MTLEEQFARLIKTLQLIEHEPWKWDVPGLEIEFGVARATVERDIRLLRQWGTIRRKEGYFAIKSLKFLPTSFTPSEALALVLAGSVAAERIGMPPTQAIRSALQKIDSMLTDQVDAMIRKMKKRVSVGVNLIRECSADVLDTISRAVSSHNPLDITYYVPGRDELTSRRVDPYGLTFRFGAWYVIGYCHLRGDVRTFGVDRIRKIKVVNTHFKYPGDFDLEGYLEKGWSLQADAHPETVVLRFSKDVAGWIAGCKFHPHQKTTVQPDGSLLFEVTIAGVEEIRHWVLGFGDQVEVLKPDGLRDTVASHSKNMARTYSMAVNRGLYDRPPAYPTCVSESPPAAEPRKEPKE